MLNSCKLALHVIAERTELLVGVDVGVAELDLGLQFCDSCLLRCFVSVHPVIFRAAAIAAIEQTAGRVPVIAGTGSNDIAYAIELTKYACEVGADAMLVVTPYYNKATQNGLIASFTAIADASTKPIILYNVPSRTGCNILPETVASLVKNVDNIIGIKDATGNMHMTMQMMQIKQNNY